MPGLGGNFELNALRNTRVVESYVTRDILLILGTTEKAHIMLTV